MAQGVVSGRTNEVHQRILENAVQRVREELHKAKHFAQTADMEAVRRRFERVRGMVKEARFPAEILNEIKETMRVTEITGLQKLTDKLLERAAEQARNDDVAGRADSIKEAREHLARVMALGASPDFREVSERKIEVAMMTSSREATAAPKMAANAPRAAFAGPEKAAVAREQRRFKRFVKPPLIVTIDGQPFRTLNWSIGGMALLNWPAEWETRTRIQLEFTAEGDDARFTELAQFLRVFGDFRAASVQFESVHSQALKLVQRLAGKGRAPSE